MIDPETPANAKPNVDFEVGKVELRFSDEFNGENINPARWDIVYKDRGWKFGIHRFWKKQNVKCCKDGKVEMIFTKDGDRDYSGGCLNTQDKNVKKKQKISVRKTTDDIHLEPIHRNHGTSCYSCRFCFQTLFEKFSFIFSLFRIFHSC